MSKPHHDREELRRFLAQREAEGLTFKQLAERSGVPIHVLHHRAHRDAHAAQVAAAKEPTFVEVCTGEPPSTSGIEVVLPQGLRVRLEPNFDHETFARLLSIVTC